MINWKQFEVMRLLQGIPGTLYQETDPAERIGMRLQIRDILTYGPTQISFVKADGSLREMNCTLNSEIISKNDPNYLNLVGVGHKKKKTNEEVLSVFDLDSKSWKSFRFDRLKKIRVEINLAASEKNG